jgi:hypothetical protein
MTLVNDLKYGWDDNEPDDEEQRTGFRGQPGQHSKFELDQSLNFREGVKTGPKVDREQIAIDADEDTRAVVDDMLEGMYEVDNSNDHIDVIGAAGEFFNDKSKESKQKNFPAMFPKQTLPDLEDEYEDGNGAGEVYEAVEPVEVDEPEQEEIPNKLADPDLWGSTGLPQHTASDAQTVMDRLEALDQEVDDAA